jgi:hypothetical protein
VHSLLHGLLHSLLRSLLLGLLPRLQMRTTSRSLGRRHRRKGAQATGVMTIEQQNQTVGTRAAISAGRTEFRPLSPAELCLQGNYDKGRLET